MAVDAFVQRSLHDLVIRLRVKYQIYYWTYFKHLGACGLYHRPLTTEDPVLLCWILMCEKAVEDAD